MSCKIRVIQVDLLKGRRGNVNADANGLVRPSHIIFNDYDDLTNLRAPHALS